MTCVKVFPYDLSHNTYATDRQMDGQQLIPIAQPLLKGPWPRSNSLAQFL